MIDKSPRWRKTAIAAAALWVLWGTHAHALSLGRITVQSTLGEALRAEIDVREISAEEATTLKTGIAAPEAFKSSGLQYNPVVADVQVQFQRRADGRTFIRLTSERVITEPFLDLLLEATWASGRLARDFTLLFDPPSLKNTAPAPPTPAQVPDQVNVSRPSAPDTASKPAASSPTVQTAPIAAIAKKSDAPQLQVKAGDTASALALANRPVQISLDQMLVALLRANPNAFVGDNVNRFKAGVLITIPTAADAALSSVPQASQIIAAQSLDFNAYRRKLAASSPKTPVLAADRKTQGTVQAQVEDKRPAAQTPDKLTLSKGSVQAGAEEAQIAKELSAKDNASRAAEINKNISELKQLGLATGDAATAPKSAASLPAEPGLSITASAPGANPNNKPTLLASAGSAPLAASSRSAQGSTLLDTLVKNPLVPLSALGLLLALAGFGVYRARQGKIADAQYSTFLESHCRDGKAFEASKSPAPEAVSAAAQTTSLSESLEFKLPDLDLFEPGKDAASPNLKTTDDGVQASIPSAPLHSAPVSAEILARVPLGPGLNPMDFDLGSLSLELGEPASKGSTPELDALLDPLSTKLALATEFVTLGDERGARALLEEVIAEASGDMKIEAQRALSQLQPS